MDADRDPGRRRSFLTAVMAMLGAGGAGRVVSVGAQPASGGRFQPAMHDADAWLDQIPGKHRLLLDAVNGPGAGDALLFAGNFLNGNKSGYSLADGDGAVVVCLRHFATPFAWTDAIWAKYGEPFTQMLTKVNDPKTGKAPTINLYRASGYGMQLTNLGTTIDDLVKRGVQFAVCDTATRFTARQIAEATKGETSAVYKDLVANTIPNSHYVAAGIVAVNRAQERGYTIAHCS